MNVAELNVSKRHETVYGRLWWYFRFSLLLLAYLILSYLSKYQSDWQNWDWFWMLYLRKTIFEHYRFFFKGLCIEIVSDKMTAILTSEASISVWRSLKLNWYAMNEIIPKSKAFSGHGGTKIEKIYKNSLFKFLPHFDNLRCIPHDWLWCRWPKTPLLRLGWKAFLILVKTEGYFDVFGSQSVICAKSQMEVLKFT